MEVCRECGAVRCEERYHALLSSEWDHPETAKMHGLFILVYHVQHPGRCKPWMRAAQREKLREIFTSDEDWRSILRNPKERTKRQKSVDETKDRFGKDTGSPATGSPVSGEMTVCDVCAPGDPDFPDGYPTAIEAWAKSVAEHRLTRS